MNKVFITICFMLLRSVFANTHVCANNCISFIVSSGTGCAWMCNYCANMLHTNNYYFTTPVCSWDNSGCVGNPVAGVTYQCCAN